MVFRVFYCGGCNLTYDRTALVRTVEILLAEAAVYDPNHDFVAASMSGCARGDGIAAFQHTSPENMAKTILPKRGDANHGELQNSERR